jgi:hypothetical protein
MKDDLADRQRGRRLTDAGGQRQHGDRARDRIRPDAADGDAQVLREVIGGAAARKHRHTPDA